MPLIFQLLSRNLDNNCIHIYYMTTHIQFNLLISISIILINLLFTLVNFFFLRFRHTCNLFETYLCLNHLVLISVRLFVWLLSVQFTIPIKWLPFVTTIFLFHHCSIIYLFICLFIHLMSQTHLNSIRIIWFICKISIIK